MSTHLIVRLPDGRRVVNVDEGHGGETGKRHLECKDRPDEMNTLVGVMDSKLIPVGVENYKQLAGRGWLAQLVSKVQTPETCNSVFVSTRYMSSSLIRDSPSCIHSDRLQQSC